MKSSHQQQNKDINDEIRQLIQEFERTQIKQNEILRKIKERVKQQEEERTVANRQKAPNSQKQGEKKVVLKLKEIPYTNEFKPKVGDEVRILNPKGRQPTRGIIQGFCKDNKARVKVKDQSKPIDRAWKNLVCTYRDIDKYDDGNSKRRY